MILSYTPRQLSASLIAGILNQAYIKSEVVKQEQGGDLVNFSMNNIDCSISILGNTLQIYHIIHAKPDSDLNVIKRVVNHINHSIIHTKYVGVRPDGSHLIAFHHSHWIPEDETITPGYIVKLARSFSSFQEKHLAHWNKTVRQALLV